MRFAGIFAALALCATSSLAAPGPGRLSDMSAVLSEMAKRGAAVTYSSNERAGRLAREARGDAETGALDRKRALRSAGSRGEG